MQQQYFLSYKQNMSLGFIPAILSMILCEWIAADTALYLGTLAGVSSCLLLQFQKVPPVPRIILYTTTGMLTLLSLFSLIVDKYCPPPLLPLTLEIMIMIPPIVLFVRQKDYLSYCNQLSSHYKRVLFVEGIHASLSSALITIILGTIHFLLITSIALLIHPINDVLFKILYQVIPPILFILIIAFNHWGIYHYNQVTQRTTYIPIVNSKGEVIGKRTLGQALHTPSPFLTPIIRVAIITNGKLFLKPRHPYSLTHRDYDLPIEGYHTIGETLEQSLKHLLAHATPPQIPIKNFRFHLKYLYKAPNDNRLVYLFSLDIKDESVLSYLNQGKLWTLQQIEDKLEKKIFSCYLEHEFEYLKTLIYTREKYKES